MELQEIPNEGETHEEGEGASEPMLEVKTEEEAEPDHYSNYKVHLRISIQKLYSVAIPLKQGQKRPEQDKKDGAGEKLPPDSKLSVELQEEKGKQTEGNSRLYRAACLFLTIICLVLLLVVIILSVKLQTGSTICPEREQLPQMKGGVVLLIRHAATRSARLSSPRCNPNIPAVGSALRLAAFWPVVLSWEESRRNCSSREGSLAVITNKGLQYYLTKEGRWNYWIGLRQTATTWTWEDKTELTESYWADGRSAGNCGILSSDKPAEKNWRKVSCEDSTYFICQL
ncbi:C-type lectin domain family 1 member B [Dissostichus eleginoides]|uniref:C-type lectin domain family 1 member B n=1 Tax=Dissostichus eleginoides TaxID=100907 RepID=A0AAD9FAC7_DISEL|nr:C-type lectin domain family 1 member B [Dissostichus eleginoides]